MHTCGTLKLIYPVNVPEVEGGSLCMNPCVYVWIFTFVLLEALG